MLKSSLPSTDELSFDGDSRKYGTFKTAFTTNVEDVLGVDNYATNLVKLIKYCKGDAKSLIEDCTLLPEKVGYEKAWAKLDIRFGRNHLIARSYMDAVTKGPPIRLNDYKALVRLADDMEKCQNALSQLRFTSDLDSDGTLDTISRRLPDCFQARWMKRVSRLMDSEDREPTFKDLAQFVEENAKVYSTRQGQAYAERRARSTTAAAPESKQRDKPPTKTKAQRQNVTTLATITSVEPPAPATAGPTDECALVATDVSSCPPKIVCVLCEKPHHGVARCFKFKKLSLQDKRDVVKKHNLCVCCLKSGHGSSSCDKVCPTCQKKHHFHLHDPKPSGPTTPAKPAAEKPKPADVTTAFTLNVKSQASLAILRVRVQLEGNERLCWALVDSGSNTTFVKRSVANELGLGGREYMYSVNTLTGVTSHHKRCCALTLTSLDGGDEIFVEALAVDNIPLRARYDGESHKKWQHISDLEFPEADAPIDIIIGTDCAEMFWTMGERRGERKEPIARRTLLGWILVGSTTGSGRERMANFINVDPMQGHLERMLMADFEDVKTKNPVMSVDDRRALKVMQESVKIENGKYVVDIPWNVDPEEALQNNRAMAESRLRMLRRRFDKDPKLAADYTKTVEQYITDGQARLVDNEEINTVHQWFLPHHAVFKRSNPEKCRVVFDCAAQFKGISLNDAILQGPNYLNNLTGVLIRFRKEPVAVVGDLKLIIHQCFVTPSDTRFLRFLWWPGGDVTK